jgi:hypothetical protein
MKRGEILFDHPPDDFVDNRGVAVDEEIAKGDDRAALRDPVGERGG